jgi:serine/threonine protein kinase
MRTKNIAHRDLKLSNLLFTDDTNVVTTDFGLSRIAFREKKGALVRSITICGTFPYMAPEILLRQPYNAFLVDIWALGVILYNLLNADYPFPPNIEQLIYN